ncbi:hypothetical protein J7K93_05940 [bacterium]|nr:hypothetical protein [bacterium]
MKVSQTNVSYVNYNRRALINQARAGKNELTDQIKKNDSFKHEAEALVQKKKTGISKSVDFSKPLSAHLSRDEKVMLGSLFPGVKKSFGVNAYQKVVDDTPEQETRGKSVDLTL